MAGRRLYCHNAGFQLDPGPVPKLYRLKCIEDVDGNGDYEVLWRAPIFTPATQMSLANLLDQTGLGTASAPAIKVEPTQVANPPSATLELLNSGVAGLQVDGGGVMRPQSLSFSLRVAGMQPDSFNYFVSLSAVVQTYEVPLDRDGNGRMEDGNGNVLIEVSEAKIDGRAKVRLGPTFLAGREQLIRYDALAALHWTRATRLKLAVDKNTEGANEDLEPLLR
jgi:hypothetical protein